MVASERNPTLQRSRSVSSDASSMMEPKLMQSNGQVSDLSDELQVGLARSRLEQGGTWQRDAGWLTLSGVYIAS